MANDLLLYHDVLDTRDSQWQTLTYIAPLKTRHVSDVDESYISFIRTLLICDALERRRPKTVPGTLTRSITLDIVDMSTMGRQYTEVCESVLPNVPKIDCLVSKLALAFKMSQLILLYSCFCSVNERSNVNNIFSLYSVG